MTEEEERNVYKKRTTQLKNLFYKISTAQLCPSQAGSILNMFLTAFLVPFKVLPQIYTAQVHAQSTRHANCKIMYTFFPPKPTLDQYNYYRKYKC